MVLAAQLKILPALAAIHRLLVINLLYAFT